MTIIQLPEALANKIAAGEVVERPASVVKELLENSIDANSTWIKIEVKEAGIQQIKITDNGKGMNAEDCKRAFLRHATSKIEYDDDLFHIQTLGFRGEALASIAAVSRLTLKSSTGSGAGTKIYVEGSHIKDVEKSDARQGTEITVQDLFFNTPARLKYLRTIHTELGHIVDVVNRAALAHPNVRFELIHNEKQLMQTAGKNNLQQVIASIYGMKVAKKMIQIKGSTHDYELSGWIGLPSVTRASRAFMTTIINGRYIRSIPLAKAITKAYHTLLPIHTNPIVVLHIEMDPVLVDVNVHPTKLQVRFSKEKELYEFIEKTIRTHLRNTSLIPQMKREEPRASEQQAMDLESIRQRNVPKKEDIHVPTSTIDTHKTSSIENNWEAPASYENDTTVQESIVQLPPTPSKEEIEETFEEPEQSERVPQMYPVGQVQGTYIIAQNETGMYMIDQHAAQERIKYEQYREMLAQPEKELQQLLIPITFEFSNQETLFIQESKDELEQVGLFFEPFGPQSFIIRSYPTWFPGDVETVIREMLEQIIEDKTIQIKKIREEAAIMMSCKHSIKANHYLNHEDMQELIDTLRQTTDPYTCPHGRPVMLHFSSTELEKMFKRIM